MTKARLRVRRGRTTKKQHSKWRPSAGGDPASPPVSAAVRTSPAPLREAPSCLFPVLFYPCFYSPPTAKVVFLPRCLNCPAQFAQPPLPPHREPFIRLVEGRFLVGFFFFFFVDIILEMSFVERPKKKHNCDCLNISSTLLQ